MESGMPQRKKDGIVPVSVVDEMKQAYGDYALAVIVGRAIPDLYDGLKPVHRRILTAMKWLNLRPDGRFMKSARIEGETMGKLHPQGGAYGAIVNMSQWWTNNAPLVDGHGNFGSPTDGPAAARYTEAKLTEYSYSVMLQDSDTWDTKESYDGSFQEPIRMNAKVPHVLLNGAEGIAVGMATRIPTHNLRGVAKALRYCAAGDIKNANKHLIPDIPTGCEIIEDEGLSDYLATGHGAIRMRAVCERFETEYGKRAKRDAFAFSSLPFHANTEQIGDQIKDGLAKGKITTVADVRDETDRTGIRLVVILKANVNVDQAEAELYRWTSLDSKFSASNLVIDGATPVDLRPYDILDRWLKWRDERLVVSFKAELERRRNRLEIVQGLITALDLIDDIIALIRRSKDKADARERLMKQHQFSEIQANAILEMRLSQLTKLDDKSLRNEAKEIQARIKELIKYNSSQKLRQAYILDEIDDIATRHGNARRSKIVKPPAEVAIQVVKQGRKKIEVAMSGPKPRYVFIDEEKAIITQQKRLERSSWIVQGDDKMLFVCSNNRVVKVGSRHKGPLFDGPTQILHRHVLSKLPSDPLLFVFKLGNDLRACAIDWQELAKCTQKGKPILHDDAELVYCGTDAYTVEFKGRKKDQIVSTKNAKKCVTRQKGQLLAKLSDLK